MPIARIEPIRLPDLPTQVATSGTLAMSELGGNDDTFEQTVAIVIIYRGAGCRH